LKSAQTQLKSCIVFTGDLEEDIHTAINHLHYLTLQNLGALLSRTKSINYLRRKLANMEEDKEIAVTLLPRTTGGKPLQVYCSYNGADRKHQFLEHTLDCTAALVAGFNLPQLE